MLARKVARSHSPAIILIEPARSAGNLEPALPLRLELVRGSSRKITIQWGCSFQNGNEAPLGCRSSIVDLSIHRSAGRGSLQRLRWAWSGQTSSCTAGAALKLRFPSSRRPPSAGASSNKGCRNQRRDFYPSIGRHSLLIGAHAMQHLPRRRMNRSIT